MTNTDSEIAHPAIVSQDEWLVQRKKLLDHEKDQLKHYDRVNAERRRLPMVKVEKDYVFNGPNGQPSLEDLFDGRRQLIVYHFMFEPAWETHRCPGCTGWVDALGDLSLLAKRDTTIVIVSRAPLAMLEAYKAQKRWTIPWFSSFGSDFNCDFHVTLDPKLAPVEYNYRNKEEMEAAMGHPVKMEGEEHGLSVFFRLNHDVFHTYSAYAHALESLKDAYHLLDATPYGRQQDFEDSPPGWPQKPTYKCERLGLTSLPEQETDQRMPSSDSHFPSAGDYANEPVLCPPLVVVDVEAEQRRLTGRYRNMVLNRVNKSCVRLAAFEGEYRWHHHPHSDELFLVVEGRLEIDLTEDRMLVLGPWQAAVIPAATVHRTRAIGRTVNLTFESLGAETVFVD